ncbi:hypothetical protein T10_962 [Trichinella papuae]|uniref:MD-2-related lipid-recognition domain-containing protein n=1 Tax=Trichinella papuae TaxID=268474 RepID=A0A0V1M7S0_9BILA|nr:hypothetical protein T10_962 [Trichinella papuae]
MQSVRCFLISFLFLTVLDVNLASSCEAPDGTDKHLFYTECKPEVKHSLKIKSLSIKNDKGEENYPVDMRHMMNLKVTSFNGGGVLNNIYADIDLQYFGKLLWGTCSWHSLPTMGLLRNIKQCYNCPLQPGNNTLLLNFDFSPYSAVIRLLAGGGIYAMDIVMRDADNPTDEIACLRVESKISN